MGGGFLGTKILPKTKASSTGNGPRGPGSACIPPDAQYKRETKVFRGVVVIRLAGSCDFNRGLGPGPGSASAKPTPEVIGGVWWLSELLRSGIEVCVCICVPVYHMPVFLIPVRVKDLNVKTSHCNHICRSMQSSMQSAHQETHPD